MSKLLEKFIDFGKSLRKRLSQNLFNEFGAYNHTIMKVNEKKAHTHTEPKFLWVFQISRIEHYGMLFKAY